MCVRACMCGCVIERQMPRDTAETRQRHGRETPEAKDRPQIRYTTTTTHTTHTSHTTRTTTTYLWL